MTKFDEVIKETGDIGRYQKRLLLLLVLISMIPAFMTNMPIMTLTIPDHRCAIDSYPNDTYAIQNDQHRELINQSIPWSDADQSERSSCTAYRPIVQSETPTHNNSINALEEFKCDRYVFDKTLFDRTIIEEVNIVCDRMEWRTHANMALKLVSALTQGLTSDLLGRRRSLLCFIPLTIFAMFCTSLTYNIPTMIAFPFLSGLAASGTYMNCYVLSMEFLGVRHRVAYNVVLALAWSSACFILTGAAYGLRDYVYVSIAIGCPTSLVALSAYWLVPESPRWLLSKGRFQEARKIVEHMAKVNGKPFPEATFAGMLEEEEMETLIRKKEAEKRKKRNEKKKTERILTMFLHPILALRFSILIVNWIANTMTYYGLLLNVQNLSGNLYFNFFLATCMDTAGNIVGYFVVTRMGRRRSYLGFLGISMLGCLASIFPPIYAGKDDANTILTVLSLIGRLGIATSFTIIFLLSAEIYPTTIRNTAMGVSSMASRIGSMAAPYVADMGKRFGGDLKVALPLIVFGGVAFVAWLGALLLPETSKHKLPDTIMDAVNFGKKLSSPIYTGKSDQPPKFGDDVYVINDGDDHNDDDDVENRSRERVELVQ